MERPGPIEGGLQAASSSTAGLTVGEAEAALTSQPLPTEGALRASETVSEASPSSTASQTGVPTQVVQQVQGSQQVGHGLRWGEGRQSPHFSRHEHLFTCLIRIWQ